MALKKIVVTGGAGFIGRHVVKALLDREISVVVVDDFSGSSPDNFGFWGQVKFIRGSILNADVLDEAFQDADAVIHLAADPSVGRSVEQPVLSHNLNYVGTLKVAEACRKWNLRRLVYASSAAVYGSVHNVPIVEEMRTVPQSPYGVDKLAGEFLLQCYSGLHSLSSVSLRFFNVYGEGQDPSSGYSGVVSTFARAYQEDRPILIYGDGNQVRDFVYVGDVAEAIVRSALLNMPGNLVLNVGSGNGVTLWQLLQSFDSIFRYRPEVRMIASRSGDIRFSQALVDKMEAYLGFRPMTSLTRGISRAIAHSENFEPARAVILK